ncbi:hypothetical protein [Bacillus sp. NPDC094106]|uniref:hypothetical protein n=1 Tax=Bacillus sp. NPDC094106 TaxID=3363949 RepID=UPI003813CEDE
MKFGQMSIKKASTQADYVQLDICGLTAEEALEKYTAYAPLPVILHGDWTKKGYSENNILSRYKEYIRIIYLLQKETKVYGITIHPPSKKKMGWHIFKQLCLKIEEETDCPVFIENRSNARLHVSLPEEVIAISHEVKMTIDIPQLYIACGYDDSHFIDVLQKINWINVKELHLANLKKTEKNTLVARKLKDGLLDYNILLSYLPNPVFITFEILGGVPTFESQKHDFLDFKKEVIG